MARALTTRVVEAIERLQDRQEVSDSLARILVQRYQLSFCGYSIWETGRKLFVEYVSIPADAEPQHLRMEDLDEYGFGRVVKKDHPRIIDDVERQGLREGEWRALRAFGTRSYITLPIRVRGLVAGGFGLGSPLPYHFGERDLASLKPVAAILGFKLGELGVRPPRIPPSGTSILPRRVLVLGRDERIAGWVMTALPREIEAGRQPQQITARRQSSVHPELTIYCCTNLDRREAERIERALRLRPRRTAVVCRHDDPGAVSWLTNIAKDNGLVAVESEGQFPLPMSARLSEWCFGERVGPDWEALGVSRRGQDERLERILRTIEREPFRHWKVPELASESAMSVATLNRTLKAAGNLSAKQLLMDLRYQLLDRFRRSGEVSGAHIYEMFGFSSAEAMYKWRHHYRNSRKRKSDRF